MESALVNGAAASAALGSTIAPPSAILSVYALRQGHAFELGSFIDGKMPPKADVANTQTLVSLA